MIDKEYTGLWIPKEIECRADLTHLEKLVWGKVKALPNGMRMADATIAEQLGIKERNVAKVLARMVKKGWLLKTGSYNSRMFQETTPQSVVLQISTPQGVVSYPRKTDDYPSKCSQLPPEVYLTTPQGDHKEYKRKESIEEESSAFENRTTQQAEVGLNSQSWKGWHEVGVNRPLRSEPREGTMIYNPATGENQEYER